MFLVHRTYSTYWQLVANVKVSIADFVSDHSLITANVIARTPKPVVSYVSRNLRAVDPVQFETALRNSVVFTELATTVDSYVNPVSYTHLTLPTNREV